MNNLNDVLLEDLCKYNGSEYERNPLEELDKEVTAKIELLLKETRRLQAKLEDRAHENVSEEKL